MSHHNQSRILPDNTNKRSVQAQTQEPKAFSEQRSDLTHVFLTQQKKAYFHKVAKQVYLKILLTTEKKSWYNYEKATTVTGQRGNILQTDAQNKIHEYSGIQEGLQVI